MKRSAFILVAGLGTFAAGASAQPLGLDWSFESDIFGEAMNPPNAFGELGPDWMFVRGDDGNENDFGVHSGFLAIVDYSGAFGFDWDYFTDDGPNYDRVFFYHNGGTTELTDAGGDLVQAGTFLTTVNAGDVVGIGIWTTDGCCGYGEVLAGNFVPAPGALALLGAGAALVVRRRR